MSEQMSTTQASAAAERTKLLRHAAIAKLDLMRDFLFIYPDFDQDSDMTAEQETTWDALSEKRLAEIADIIEPLK